MANESNISVLENIIKEILDEMPGYFLVQLRIKPTNNIEVFLDGDNGIAIDACIKVNRRLYAIIEEKAMFPEGDFSLEVSSPGVGEPLLLHRQYVKNIGRWVKVDGQPDGSLVADEVLATVEGELKAVNENGIELEAVLGKGKKQQLKHYHILFNNIKSTSVQIKF